MSPQRLVGLYPAAWRRRYGEEFLALLEEHPPRSLHVIDIVWGAIDAHLFAQAPEGRFRMFTRIAGVAGLGAGLAILAGFTPFIPNITEFTVPVFYGLATVAIFGIHLRQVTVRPALAWLGFALGLLGLVSGIAFVVLTRAGVIPTSGGEVGWLAGIALWIGSSALGAVMLAIRVFPTVSGLAFAIGSPIAMMGLVANAATLSGGALDILGQVGILIAAMGWLVVGWSMLAAQPQEGVLGPAT
jgi:hypothetical protein